MYADEGHRLVLVDRRNGGHEVGLLAGPSARIFLYLDHHRSRGQLAEAFPQLGEGFVDTLLLSWLHKRWIRKNGDRYLSVVPRKGPALMRPEVAPRRPGRKLPLSSDISGLA